MGSAIDVCNEEDRFPFNLIGLDLSDSEASFVENMETGQPVFHKKGRFILIPSYTRVYYRNRGDYDFTAIHFNLTFCYGIDLFRNCDRFFVWEDPHWAEPLQPITSSSEDEFRKISAPKTVIWNIRMRFPPVFDRNLPIAGNRYLERWRRIWMRRSPSLIRPGISGKDARYFPEISGKICKSHRTHS